MGLLSSLTHCVRQGSTTPKGRRKFRVKLSAKTCNYFRLTKKDDSPGGSIDQRFCLLANYFGVCYYRTFVLQTPTSGPALMWTPQWDSRQMLLPTVLVMPTIRAPCRRQYLSANRVSAVSPDNALSHHALTLHRDTMYTHEPALCDANSTSCCQQNVSRFTW